MSTKYRQPPSAPLHDPIIPNSFGQRQRHDYPVITRKNRKVKKGTWLGSFPTIQPAKIFTLEKGVKIGSMAGLIPDPSRSAIPGKSLSHRPLAVCLLHGERRRRLRLSLRYLQVNKPAREIRILIIHPPAYNIPKEKKTKARRDATHASKREASAAVSTKEANTAWVLFSCLAAA